jgi:hypothetical protein
MSCSRVAILFYVRISWASIEASSKSKSSNSSSSSLAWDCSCLRSIVSLSSSSLSPSTWSSYKMLDWATFPANLVMPLVAVAEKILLDLIINLIKRQITYFSLILRSRRLAMAWSLRASDSSFSSLFISSFLFRDYYYPPYREWTWSPSS